MERDMAFAMARRAIEDAFPDRADEILKEIETPLSFYERGNRELADFIENAKRTIREHSEGSPDKDPQDGPISYAGVISTMEDEGCGPDRWLLVATQGWAGSMTSELVENEAYTELAKIVAELLAPEDTGDLNEGETHLPGEDENDDMA